MILFLNIVLSILSKEEKSYKWKLHFCKRCNCKMWGHGYVLRYFTGFPSGLWLKRYRCNSCRTVVTTRPIGYWKRIQSSIQEIYEALLHRLQKFKWKNPFLRQRQVHWLNAFHKYYQMEHPEKTESVDKYLMFCFQKELKFLS